MSRNTDYLMYNSDKSGHRGKHESAGRLDVYSIKFYFSLQITKSFLSNVQQLEKFILFHFCIHSLLYRDMVFLFGSLGNRRVVKGRYKFSLTFVRALDYFLEHESIVKGMRTKKDRLLFV